MATNLCHRYILVNANVVNLIDANNVTVATYESKKT